MDRARVIVIGGGIAGLTAAAYAARNGAEVMLFERAAEPGGRARTFEERGFLFNMGPHALYRNGPAEEVLADLGVGYTHGATLAGVTRVAMRGGTLFPMTGGIGALLASGIAGEASRAGTEGILQALRETETSTVRAITLREWLIQESPDPVVREVIEAYFRLLTYSNAAGCISAGAAIDHYRHSSRNSVVYLDEGWQTLVDGLRTAAVDAGATVRPGVRVEEVLHDGAVRGVRLAGGEVAEADAVVISTEPGSVAKLLPGSTDLAARLGSLVPARAACLDVALERLPVDDRVFAIGVDRPYYMSVHTRSARLAQGGQEIVSVAKYLPVNEPNDPDADERELEGWLDIVQPGWRDVFVTARYLPSMTVMHAVATADGGGLEGRPGIDSTGVEGVLLAGDWVGATGMLADVSFASGKAAGLRAAETPARQLAAV